MASVVTWSGYRESIGDRSSLFSALADAWPIERVVYPGSYVDLSPSIAFPSVLYVDTDARAARFFADRDLVGRELAGRTRPGAGRMVAFLGADYTYPLDLPDASADLLISLFAGPVWEHCRRYLRAGGWLLANTSHGDASVPPSTRRCGWWRPCTTEVVAGTGWSPTGSAASSFQGARGRSTRIGSELAGGASPTHAPRSPTSSSAATRQRSRPMRPSAAQTGDEIRQVESVLVLTATYWPGACGLAELLDRARREAGSGMGFAPGGCPGGGHVGSRRKHQAGAENRLEASPFTSGQARGRVAGHGDLFADS